MRSRIASIAMIGVMASVSSAQAGVLTAPSFVMRAPILSVPALINSPALTLTSLLAVPSLPGLPGVPVPLAASPVPLAAVSAPAIGEPVGVPMGPHIVDQIVTGRASPRFVKQIKAHLKANMPEAILRDMLKDGYRIEVNSRVRQGRMHLLANNDYTGGYHTYGPKGKFIVIAEEIKNAKTEEWDKSTVWENSITHEIGHAASYVLGNLSEDPKFKTAWTKDLDAMPDDLKAAKREDGFPNRFRYYTQTEEDGQRGRAETFAEGFDVLLRGEASHFNYAIFTRRFPKVLAEIRASLERVYGPIFVK